MGKYKENRLFVPNNPNAPTLCPELAQEIGLNESILLLQLQFWMAIAENIREGRRWTFQSLTDIEKFFPFWSRRTIQRILCSLKKQGLILVKQFNRRSYDRTNWYALDEEGIARLRSVRLVSIEPQRPDRWRQNGAIEDDRTALFDDDSLASRGRQDAPTIPETSTETSTEISAEAAGSEKWAEVLRELRLQLTRATFDTWVKPTVGERMDGHWRVTCVNEYGRDWLANRLDSTIRRTLAFVLEEPVEHIEYVVKGKEDAASEG